MWNFCGFTVFEFVPPTEKLPSPPRDRNSIFCRFCLLWPSVAQGLFEGTCAHGIRRGRSKFSSLPNTLPTSSPQTQFGDPKHPLQVWLRGTGGVERYTCDFYPSEGGQQLERDPSEDGSCKPLVLKEFFCKRNTLGLVPHSDMPVLCTPPTSSLQTSNCQEISGNSMLLLKLMGMPTRRLSQGIHQSFLLDRRCKLSMGEV